MKRFALILTVPAMLLASACSAGSAGASSAPAGSSSATSAATAKASTAASSAASSSAAGPKVNVYTSTNVWGSVAQAVGGQYVDVHSSITKPDQDPHDYEATAQDKQAASNATVAIMNGGGYDDWAADLTKSGKATLINAVDLSGLKKDGDKDFNEHVFYNLDVVKQVSDEVAKDLGKADAAHAATYTANAKAFDAKLDTLKQNAAKVGEGKKLTAFATEPVTGYLMNTMGIENVTPDTFVEESETDAGPSTKTQAEAQDVIKTGKAKLLVLNAQTETDVTKALATAATAAKVPTVKVNETFPEGISDYATWVQKTIDDFSAAAKQVK